MAALAERRIIPHDELKARAEEKSEAQGRAQGQAEVRPEHLRLLEALLFAAAVPLDEKTLAARLPEDVDIKDALRALQAEFAGAESIWFRSATNGLPHRRRSVVASHQGERVCHEEAVAPAIETLAEPLRGRTVVGTASV